MMWIGIPLLFMQVFVNNWNNVEAVPHYEGCVDPDLPECADLARILGTLMEIIPPRNRGRARVLLPVPAVTELIKICDMWEKVLNNVKLHPHEKCCHLEHHCHHLREKVRRTVDFNGQNNYANPSQSPDKSEIELENEILGSANNNNNNFNDE